ncbi:MAG TPA: hypothetical protein VNX66_04960 [Candidatus Sulfotelmatobacter sp.]|jgi:hypothetical protein|nr:hypothetical protein [Candidatus Sulfotelmatobacter sp.]
MTISMNNLAMGKLQFTVRAKRGQTIASTAPRPLFVRHCIQRKTSKLSRTKRLRIGEVFDLHGQFYGQDGPSKAILTIMLE